MISGIKRIIKWAEIYRKRIYLGFLFAVLDALCGAMPIMVAANALNLILSDRSGEGALTGAQILVTLAFLVLLVLGRWLFSYLRSTTQDSVVYEVTEEERLKIGDKLKRFPLGFFKKNSTGELATTLTTELSFFEMHGMHMIDVVVNSYLFISFCILSFLFFEPVVSLTCLGGVAVSGAGLYIIQKISRKNAPLRQAGTDGVASATLEYIRGMAIVKSFKQEGAAVKGIRNAYETTKKSNIRFEKEYARPDVLHRFALYAATTAIMLFCTLKAADGAMLLPVMVMLVLFSFVMFNSVEAVNNSVLVLEILDATLDKLEKIKNAEPIDRNGHEIDIETYDISFENVSFAYDTVPVLQNVTFTIPQKTTTAIVGPSGSGKTTLCSLIARFYDVSGGRITVGGSDVREFICDSLLKNISMVFQNVYLFHDTILNNIKFGKPDATMEEIIEASKQARCHDFVTALPNGYNTVVGEGGSSLSGGEKQRISIARAMLKNAPIVILDEATASVNPENEHFVQAAISALTHGKTIIIIAHRLATIENADQILVLDEGHIAQMGTHKQLLDQDGIYRRFVSIRKQAEGWSIA